MTFADLNKRVSEGECVPCSEINGIPVDIFISKNWNHFQNLTVENDLVEAGVCWIYSLEAVDAKGYNPCKN